MANLNPVREPTAEPLPYEEAWPVLERPEAPSAVKGAWRAARRPSAVFSAASSDWADSDDAGSQ